MMPRRNTIHNSQLKCDWSIDDRTTCSPGCSGGDKMRYLETREMRRKALCMSYAVRLNIGSPRSGCHSREHPSHYAKHTLVSVKGVVVRCKGHKLTQVDSSVTQCMFAISRESYYVFKFLMAP